MKLLLIIALTYRDAESALAGRILPAGVDWYWFPSRGKRLIGVGPKPNLFCHGVGVWYESFDDLLAALTIEREAARRSSFGTCRTEPRSRSASRAMTLIQEACDSRHHFLACILEHVVPGIGNPLHVRLG